MTRLVRCSAATGAIVLGALLVFPAGAYAAPATAKVYVSNVDGDTVSVIDVDSQSLLATIPVGDEPRNLAVSPSGDELYVPNRGSDSVSVISTTTDLVVATLTGVSFGFDEPYAVAFTPDGAQAWVVNKKGGGSSDGTVTVISTSTRAVIDVIDHVCFVSPEGIVVSATTAYVVSRQGDSVCPVSVATRSVGAAITVGSEPRSAVLTPSGAFVYVANNGGSVSKIATASNTVVGTINTGGKPRNLGMTGSGAKIYVPLQSGSVAVITTSNDAFTTVAIPGASSTYGAAVVPDQVVAIMTLGLDDPALGAAANELVYVTDESIERVWVLNSATDEVVSTPDLVNDGEPPKEFNTPRAVAAVGAAELPRSGGSASLAPVGLLLVLLGGVALVIAGRSQPSQSPRRSAPHTTC